jgi:cell division protein FtsB
MNNDLMEELDFSPLQQVIDNQKAEIESLNLVIDTQFTEYAELEKERRELEESNRKLQDNYDILWSEMDSIDTIVRKVLK